MFLERFVVLSQKKAQKWYFVRKTSYICAIENENKRELLTNDNVLSAYERYHANVDDDDHHDDDPSGLG